MKRAILNVLLLGALVMGTVLLIESGDCNTPTGCAQLWIDWNDANLRINRARIINNKQFDVRITVSDVDENGVRTLIVTKDYPPGPEDIDNIPGAANRRVTITEIAPGDFELDLEGISVNMVTLGTVGGEAQAAENSNTLRLN